MVPGVRVDRVRFGYNRTPVFMSLSAEIPHGARTAVVGSNGCGKSTLLGLLAGTLRPQGGTIDLGGPPDVAFAVQHSQVAETFPITVGEAVAMGRWRRLGLLRRPTRIDRDIVDYWIAELGLDDLRCRRLGDLSGGQRQRTLLAQTFTQQSQLVLLDEPTAGLDAQASDQLARQLARLGADGTTIVAATHDLELGRTFDFAVLLGGGGVLAAGTPAEVLTESNLASALTLG